MIYFYYIPFHSLYTIQLANFNTMSQPQIQSTVLPALDQAIPFALVGGGLLAFLRKKSTMSLVGSSSCALLWFLREKYPVCGLLSGLLLVSIGAMRFRKVEKKAMPLLFVALGGYMSARSYSKVF